MGRVESREALLGDREGLGPIGDGDKGVLRMHGRLEHDPMDPYAAPGDAAGQTLPAADKHPLVETARPDSDGRFAQHQRR